ncbi:MAG TPA: hypothetical protein VJB60_00405 [Candidatus Peribacterales bacterium]|nr:hypothetical protein [Candidatus Peribacterales bacterium]
MAQQEISPFSKRITILIGLSVVSAMMFGLSISFYRNLLFEDTLRNLSTRNKDLRKQIDENLDELAYYRSYQYRDKYAKENLGRVQPGEKVLIFTDLPTETIMEEEEELSLLEQREISYRQYLEKIPVLEHWRMYLFDPEGIQKLRQSF